MTSERFRTIDIVRSEVARFPSQGLSGGPWYEWEQAPMRTVEIYVVDEGSRRLVARVENASGEQVKGETF